MTEKTVKSLKNKSKQLKTKNVSVPKKVVESDSDISDSEASGNAPKLGKKELKVISTEVTDLLASLKKQHGIVDVPVDDEPAEVKPAKAQKNKKDVKAAAVPAKKAKVAQQPEKKVAVKQEKPKAKENKKQQPAAKGNAEKKVVAKAPAATKGPVAPKQDNPNQKKNQKNQKRAAETVVVKTEPAAEPPTKKAKENAKQKQKQEKKKPVVKQEVKSEPASDDENEAAEETEESNEKKDHHLKDAVPVFVGNLPTNVKRHKLLKMFKKFGKVLSIRFRTNTGKSFCRKTALKKAPHVIAFIYFDSRENAEAAVALNGEKYLENVITVDVDSKDKIANIKPQNTVVVGNLKYAVTDHILREAFKCCGEIEHIRVVQTDRGCKGVAFIRFAKPESCALALKLHGTQILEREVRVERYQISKSLDTKINTKKQKTPKAVQKKKNANKAKDGAKPNGPKAGGDDKKKKKNKEFLGVKSNDAKKNATKNKKKKTKISNEKRLALKVAPKAEKPSA